MGDKGLCPEKTEKNRISVHGEQNFESSGGKGKSGDGMHGDMGRVEKNSPIWRGTRWNDFSVTGVAGSKEDEDGTDVVMLGSSKGWAQHEGDVKAMLVLKGLGSRGFKGGDRCSTGVTPEMEKMTGAAAVGDILSGGRLGLVRVDGVGRLRAKAG